MVFAEYDPGTVGLRDESVTVRRAVHDDAPGIVAVDATRAPRPESHLEWVRDELTREDAFLVVAEAGGRVVGSSAVKIWRGHSDVPVGWYVSGITVLPPWRRKGVADRMLEAELAWLDERGARAWSVVNATNRASLDLHVQHGFVEISRGSTFAGLTFSGGSGVLLRRPAAVAAS